MKTSNNILKLLLVTITILTLPSCEKFLLEKSDKKLSMINSVSDLQSLLDNTPVLSHKELSIPDICSDNYFITDAAWKARSETEQRLYIWEDSFVLAQSSNAWKDAYDQIFIANTVLSEVKNFDNSLVLEDIEGQALFYRAKAFFNLSSVFCLAYNSETAKSDLGLPLRLDPDFNKQSVRASLEETYAQIIIDFQGASKKLNNTASFKTKPIKAAAYGYLARTYLNMRRYEDAEKYADSALMFKSTLLDYNSINVNVNFPFSEFNAEVIYDGRFPAVGTITQSIALVHPDLYKLYDEDDVRKNAFYRPTTNLSFQFKGNYTGRAVNFSGITTAEMFIVRAECNTRLGNLAKALTDYNHLRKYRYKNDKYTIFNTQSSNVLLEKILEERRKELVMRGQRWADIKRLNLEGRNITLKRTIENTDYILEPNSLRYAIAIPEDIIELSGIRQNLR